MEYRPVIPIPVDVPQKYLEVFADNYHAITAGTGKLFLLTGDQKLEHLNKNYYGPKIPVEVNNPEHLFAIASKGRVGAFAAHLGLIARYGSSYPTINYLVKLNGKTNIIPTTAHDPISIQLWTVKDVIAFKESSGLPIRAIGYTIYLGSQHESTMLAQAAQTIYEAHCHGLVAVLWMYPRGNYVIDELSIDMIAGAAGVATTLGADFAKINPPTSSNLTQQAALLQVAAQAAGNTKLICSGGVRIDQKNFLEEVYTDIHQGNTWGRAIGRNIYQQKLSDAIAFSHAVASLIFDNKTVEEAFTLYLNKKENT